MDYGYDYEYARSRLNDTVVLYSGVPYKVEHISSEGVVELVTLTGTELIFADLNELDVSPFPLGFVNQDGRAIYSFRIPARYYKQGLNYNTLRYVGSSKPNLFSMSFQNTVLGKFSKVFDAYEGVYLEDCLSRAFSRNFAFSKPKSQNRVDLFFKKYKVGVVEHMDNEQVVYKLHDEYTYLTEMLEESLNVQR